MAILTRNQRAREKPYKPLDVTKRFYSPSKKRRFSLRTRMVLSSGGLGQIGNPRWQQSIYRKYRPWQKRRLEIQDPDFKTFGESRDTTKETVSTFEGKDQPLGKMKPKIGTFGRRVYY